MSFYLKKAGQCLTVDLPFMHCELLPRVELGTSSLPRMRSTTELKQHKSERRDSNPRPPAWKASALSTELLSREREVSSRLCGCGWIRTTEVEDSRFTVCPIWPLWNTPNFKDLGASSRTRTNDRWITNLVLYQLSYRGATFYLPVESGCKGTAFF